MSLFIFYRYILIIPIMRASQTYIFGYTYIDNSIQSAGTNTNNSNTSSVALIGMLLSIFNTICVLIFGLVLVHHDFTYSFQTKNDKLSRRKSIASKIIVISDVWISVLSSPTLIFFIQMGFSLIDLYSFWMNMIFYDYQIARFYFQISCIRLLLHLLLLLSSYFASQTDLSAILIISIPVIWQIATYILRFLEIRLPHMSFTDLTNPQKVDIHLRSIMHSILNIQHSTYLDTEKGVIFESILNRHREKCNKNKVLGRFVYSKGSISLQQQEGQKSRNSSECSCKNLIQILKNIDNDQVNEVRKKLIHLYLNENYLDSKNKYSENICSTFYYLAYQVEISESPINALILLIEYETTHQKKLSLHYQMILADFKKKAQIRFDNQQKLKNILKSNLLDGIKYDFWLQNIDQNLFKCLNQLKYINSYLSNDYFDLYNLHQKSERLVHDLKQLEKYFLYVYQINPNSPQLQYYLNAYTNIFDLRLCNIQNIIKSQQIDYAMHVSELDLNICDSRNCILFVSLLQQIGHIKLQNFLFQYYFLKIYSVKSVTRNSEKVIGKPPSELIHQSINQIIPYFIAKFHDQIIKNVITNGFLQGSKDANLKDSNHYQFFAKDNKNFIFPIVLQLKLQIFGKCKDFGVSAIIQRANNQSNQYILIDQKYSLRGKTFTIQNITKILYKICFKKVLGDNQSNLIICLHINLIETCLGKLQGLDINKLIPLMEVLNQEDKDRNKIGTIMLYPQTANHCNIFKKNNKILKNGKDIGWFFMFALASNCGMLDIDINLKIRKTQIGEIYKEIEITRIKKIYKPGDRLTSMSTLKYELSSRMGVSIFIGGAQLKKTFEIVEQGDSGQHNQSSFRKFQRLAKETKLIDSKDGSQLIVNKTLLPNKTKINKDDYQTTSSDENFDIEDPIQVLMKSNPSIKDAQTFNSSQRVSMQASKKVEFNRDKQKRNSNLNQKNGQIYQYDKKNSINGIQQQFRLKQFETEYPQSEKQQSKEEIQEIESKESQQSIKSQKPADMRKTLINNSQRLIQQCSQIDNQEQPQNFYQHNFKESDQKSESFRKKSSFNYDSHSIISNSKRNLHHGIDLDEQSNAQSLKEQNFNNSQENFQQLNLINEEIDFQNQNTEKQNQQKENSSKQKSNQDIQTLQQIKLPTVTVLNDDFQVIETTQFQSRGELDRIQTFQVENESTQKQNQNKNFQESERILTFQTRADYEKYNQKHIKQLNKQEKQQIEKNSLGEMKNASLQDIEQIQDKIRGINSSLSSIQKNQLKFEDKNISQLASSIEEQNSQFKNNEAQGQSEKIISNNQISNYQINKNVQEVDPSSKLQQSKFTQNKNINEPNHQIQKVEINNKDKNQVKKKLITNNSEKNSLHQSQSSKSDDSSSNNSITNEIQQTEFREDSAIQTFNVLDYIQYKQSLQNKSQNQNNLQNIIDQEISFKNQSQQNLKSETQQPEQISDTQQVQTDSKSQIQTESSNTLKSNPKNGQSQPNIQQDNENEQVINGKQSSLNSLKEHRQNKKSLKKIYTFDPDIDIDRVNSESHQVNNVESEIQYHKTIDHFKTYDAIDSQYIKSNTRKLSSDTQSHFQLNPNQQNNRFSLLNQNIQSNQKIIKLQEVQIEQSDKIDASQIECDQIAQRSQIYSENNIVTKQSNELSQNKIDNSEYLDDHYDEDENKQIEEELNDHAKIFYQENSFQEAGSQTDTFQEKNSDIKSSKSRVSQKKFITKEQDKIRKQSIKMLFQVSNKNYVLPKNLELTSQDLNTEDAKSVDQDSAQNDKYHRSLDEDNNQNERKLSNLNSQDNDNNLENRRRRLLQEHDDNVFNQRSNMYRRKSNKISKFIFQKNITVSQTISKIGYFAFFLLFFFTLFVFFSLLVQQQSIQDIIPYLSFGPKMLYELSQVIMNKEFQQLSQYIDSSNQQIYNQSNLTNRTQTQLNQFRETLTQAEIIQSQNLPSQLIINLKISYFDEKQSQDLQSGNIISVFEHMFLILWQYSNQINGQEPLKIIHLNSQLFLSDIQQITEYFYNWTQTQLDQTKIYLQIGTYSILAISSLIIFVIVPLYAKLQLLKEKIMIQFATFSCDVINKRNMQIDEILIILRKNQVKNEGNSEKQLRNEWKNIGQTQVKKKSISRTNNLKLWNLGLFLLSIICLLLLSIYPLINYFMTLNFLQEYRLFINELSTIQNSRAQMIYANAISFLFLNEQISQLNFIPFEKQQSTKDQIIQSYETSIQSLSGFQNDFSSYLRYKESIQYQILIDPLTSNTCQALYNIKNLSVYSSNIFQIDFDQTSCQQVKSGILSQGSIISLKNMVLNTQDIWAFLELNLNTLPEVLVSNFQNLDKNINISQIMLLGDFIDLSFQISTAYTQQVIKLFFSYLNILQSCLLSYSIIQLLLFIIFGWRQYIKYIQKEIIIVKSFYSLLSNELVVNNNYIYSFIKSYYKK
ncbi:hypothetical protein ABPG72_000070 [Tetrahymena utriculariae]